MLLVIHELMIVVDLHLIAMLDALKMLPTCKKTVCRMLDKLVNECVTRVTVTPELQALFHITRRSSLLRIYIYI